MKKNPNKEENLHAGHRGRMLEKLFNDSPFEEHELLEILLFLILPRIDTNEIAHKLINNFASLSAVLDADPKKLMYVAGVGPETARKLACFGKIYKRLDKTNCYFDKIPSLTNPELLLKTIVKRFEGARQEYADIIGFGKNGDCMGIKRFTSYEAREVKIPPEEIAEFIAIFKPQSVILAHNHLTDNLLPSEKDIDFTIEFCKQLSLFNIKLIDHVIVGPAGVNLLRGNGPLDKIENVLKEKGWRIRE